MERSENAVQRMNSLTYLSNIQSQKYTEDIGSRLWSPKAPEHERIDKEEHIRCCVCLQWRQFESPHEIPCTSSPILPQMFYLINHVVSDKLHKS
jgi:hypothetical protein